MVESLTIGPLHTLVQNVVYALPTRATTILSNAALEISNTTDFAAHEDISADVPTKLSGAFLRCTTGAAIVTLKAD